MSNIKTIVVNNETYDIEDASARSNIAELQEAMPSSLSDLTDDSNHRTVSDSEKSAWNSKADTKDIPNVPSWALQNDKPKYTASEVGAMPSDTIIPDQLSDLTSDSTHRLVTDAEKTAWNAKAEVSDIPTKASDIDAMDASVTHLSGDVPTTRKVNGKALSSDITLSASDVNALPSTTTSLPANGGNADTVNNHTVNTDVPVNAVFTDTYEVVSATQPTQANGGLWLKLV